ncbi:MAG: hypothetical protein NC184_07765 [Roseburia sp.]|nr:hypothetical protein [Roseburia sp.]
MLNYAVFLQLRRMLGGVSELTSQLKTTVGGYAHEAERFLGSLSAFADEQRLPVSSDIAVELQKLVSYDGKEQARQSSRKARDIYAVGCVERVHSRIGAYLDKYEKTYSECADACRQIAAQVFAADRRNRSADEILTLMRTTEALRPYYAQLVGAVGIFNLRTVMDAVLPQAVQN